ncbi:uncharacterized protein LOC141905787 isoform X2 [Tubulanus polymorphus]|uniref:uncharacterized protein LOC141905787 isoform X2 n=1 Tax=Tubulanus polymorphus TaxID=672921 RepID=UPI003DA46326
MCDMALPNTNHEQCDAEDEETDFESDKTHSWKPKEFIEKYGLLLPARRRYRSSPEELCSHVGNIIPIVTNREVIAISDDDKLYLDKALLELTERNAITIQRAVRKYIRREKLKTPSSLSSTGGRSVFKNGEMIYVDDEFNDEDDSSTESEKLRMKEASKKIFTHYTRRSPHSEDNSDIFPTGSVSDERLLRGATDAVKNRRSVKYQNQNNSTANHDENDDVNDSAMVTMRRSTVGTKFSDPVAATTDNSSSTYSSVDDQDRDSIKTHESYESCQSDVFVPDARSSPVNELDTSAPKINPEKVKFLFTDDVPRPIIKRRKERSQSVTDLFRGVADNDDELPNRQHLQATSSALDEEPKTPDQSLESLDDIDEAESGNEGHHHSGLKRKKSKRLLFSNTRLMQFKTQEWWNKSIRRKHSGQLPKQTFNSYSPTETKPGKIFGARLCDQIEQCGDVYGVFIKLIDAIENSTEGLESHGIYRIGGAMPVVKKLRALIEEDFSTVEYDEYSVTVLTSILKSFLHDLPETLLTDDLYDEFITTAEAESDQQALCLTIVMNKLPETNRKILDHLLTHLAKVCSKIEKNSMGPRNVAICFAPNLLTKRQIDMQETSEHNDKLIKILSVLIEDRLQKLIRTGEIRIEVEQEIVDVMEDLLQKLETNEILVEEGEQSDVDGGQDQLSPTTISAIILASKAILDDYESMFKPKPDTEIMFDLFDIVNSEEEAVVSSDDGGADDIVRGLLEEILEAVAEKCNNCDSIFKDVNGNNETFSELTSAVSDVNPAAVHLSTSSEQSGSNYEDVLNDDIFEDARARIRGYEGPLSLRDSNEFSPSSVSSLSDVSTSEKATVINDVKPIEIESDSIRNVTAGDIHDIPVTSDSPSDGEDDFLDCSDDKLCLLKN